MDILDFSGDHTIRTAAETRIRLLEALRSEDAVVHVRCQPGELDLSLIQLLIAARKSALAAGKQICLTVPADGAFLDVLQRGGFVQAADDAASPEAGFWTTGSMKA